MGYTEGTGPEGLDSFTNTPQTTADLNRLVALISRMGNLRKGATAGRDAITGTALYEGLFWWDTTLDSLFVYDGTGWVFLLGKPGNADVTLTTGATTFINQTHTLKTTRDAARKVTLRGRVSRSAGTGAVVGTVVEGFRPPETIVDVITTVGSGNSLGPSFYVTVEPSGVITLVPLNGTWNTGVFISFQMNYDL